MSVPIVNLPNKYAQGLQSAYATTTTLTIAAGQCRDSTNVYDMVSSAAITLNAANVGLNGIDTGALAATKMYALYLISDPISGNATGAILSLSATAPALPSGYSVFRLIGWWATDGSSHFLAAYTSGDFNDRKFFYDAARATAITAGAATTYTLVSLVNLVPLINNLVVYLAVSLLPGAAGRTLSLQPATATGDMITITGQVSAVSVTQQLSMLAQITSSLPQIGYKVSNSGDAAAISVYGFDYSI